MWFGFILAEIISGLMFSNAETVPVISNRFGTLLSNREADTCGLWDTINSNEELNGCPEIPLIRMSKKIKNKKVLVAARIYDGPGNGLSSLSCNGGCLDYEAETKVTNGGKEYWKMGSVIVNPGCTMFVFPDYKWGGTPKPFPAGTYSKVKAETAVASCGDIACVASLLFTCKQVLPSCTPVSAWQTVTTLNNTDSSIEANFSYKKTVGTTFSQSITTSIGISVTLSEAIEASFYDIFKSTTTLSATTHYDWTKLDTEETSNATTYTVDVTIPAGMEVFIEEVVGTCGGSKIHTQMFRVVDPIKNKILRTHQGKIKSYSLA